LILRYFTDIDALHARALWWSLAGIAALSMSVGNLLGLLQDNVKRLLAYSSISHLGYMLVALLAGGPLAVEAVSVYLVVYFITTIGAFGVVSLLSDATREADSMEDYRALFWRRPWIAGIFSIMLLSLAGIPLTAGFIGKFYVIAAGADSSLWLLLVLLAINSVIGLFYYLRVIVAMSADLGEPAHRRTRPPRLPIATADGLVLAALSGLLLWIGLFPGPLIRLVQIMEKSLLG
jgi:NADH-quinone oxidoreductase subunit N